MFDITHAPDAASVAGADLAVVPVFAERTPVDGDALAPDFDAISALLDAKDFTGKSGQTLFLQTGGMAAETLLVGLGDDVDLEAIRRCGERQGDEPIRNGGLHPARCSARWCRWCCSNGLLAGCLFLRQYKSEPQPSKVASVVFAGGPGISTEIERARTITEGVILARDLVNRPALDKPPTAIAAIAADLADNIDVKIYEEAEIEEAGFGGLIAVNRERIVLHAWWS